MSSYTATRTDGQSITAELVALGCTGAIAGIVSNEHRPAVMLRKNGREEIVTRQIFDNVDYQEWIVANFADEIAK